MKDRRPLQLPFHITAARAWKADDVGNFEPRLFQDTSSLSIRLDSETGIKVWRWSLGSSSGWQDDASLFKLLYHIAWKILPYRISGCQVKTDSKHQHNKMQQPNIISLNIWAYYNTNISTTFHGKYHAEEENMGYKWHI